MLHTCIIRNDRKYSLNSREVTLFGTAAQSKEWRALEMANKWINIKVTYHLKENKSEDDSYVRVGIQ